MPSSATVANNPPSGPVQWELCEVTSDCKLIDYNRLWVLCDYLSQVFGRPYWFKRATVQSSSFGSWPSSSLCSLEELIFYLSHYWVIQRVLEHSSHFKTVTYDIRRDRRNLQVLISHNAAHFCVFTNGKVYFISQQALHEIPNLYIISTNYCAHQLYLDIPDIRTFRCHRIQLSS